MDDIRLTEAEQLEIDTAPVADKMAKARAVKAAKVAAKAQADLERAEREQRSANSAALSTSDLGPQPVKSTLHSKRLNTPNEGQLVRMKVTPWGDGQISTGGEFGFERYGMGAIFDCPEKNARTLFEKRWAEPLDDHFVGKWIMDARRDQAVEARAYKEMQDVLEHGVGAGREYNTHSHFGGLAPS